MSRSISRTDYALTAIGVALGTALMVSNVETPEEGLSGVPFAAIPLFALVTLPLLLRTADPLRALGAVLMGLTVHTAIFGELVRCGAAFVVLGLLAYSAGRHLEGRNALTALGVAAAGTLLVGVGDFLGFGVIVLGLPAVALAWGAGRFLAARAPAIHPAAAASVARQ